MSLLSIIGDAASAALPIAGTIVGGPLGGVIGAGLGGLASGLTKMDEQNDVNKAQEKLLDYNSPANQMARFKAAGINPYFALGNVTSGNGQSIPEYGPSFSANAQRISSINNTVSSLYNANLQKPKIAADVSRSKSDIDVNKSQIDLNNSYAQRAFAERDYLQLQSDAQDIKNYLLAKYGDSQATADLEKIASEIANNDATRKLTQADVHKVASDILLNYAQIKNLNVNSSNVQAMYPFLVAKLKAEVSNLAVSSANTSADTKLKQLEGGYQEGENKWQNTKNAASLVTGIVTDIAGAGFGAGAIKSLFKGAPKMIKGFGR